jgi:acyl transferase domain-containing protein
MLARDPEVGPAYQATGNGQAILSNRISYFFDLKGPSITIDTACSASLTALHLACQSLRTGESEMAIVGGTNMIFSPDIMVAMSLLRSVLWVHADEAYAHVHQISVGRWKMLHLRSPSFWLFSR